MNRRPEIVEEIIQQLDSPILFQEERLRKRNTSIKKGLAEQINRTKSTVEIPSLQLIKGKTLSLFYFYSE